MTPQLFFLVTHEPKAHLRRVLTAAVCLMAAHNRPEAVRKAVERHPEHFGDDPRFCKPKAVLARDGAVWRL